MRAFNYLSIKEQKWDSEILGLIAAIYRYAGKQELYLKQRPNELKKFVEIAKIQSTEASNAIEGIVTTNTRIKQLVEEKTTPKNRDEQEIAGYCDVLNVIHESFDAVSITKNYILQLHKILYSHMNNPLAGQTKNVQNYISATYPDGHTQVLFTPLAPFETPEALDRICEEYNLVIGNLEVEPLIAIPIFIHDFLCIHPFNDADVIIGTRLENPVKSTGLHSLVPIFMPERGERNYRISGLCLGDHTYIAGQRYESLIVIKAVIPSSGDGSEGSMPCYNRFMGDIFNSGAGGYFKLMP